MGRIAGIRIKNYGTLKNVKMGRLLFDATEKELTNMNAIIGQSGTGKSTLADAFGFLADCLEKGAETACDLNNRGGYEKIVSQGAKGSIEFEIYYRETSNEPPITYELSIGIDKNDRPVVEKERLRQRRGMKDMDVPCHFYFWNMVRVLLLKETIADFAKKTIWRLVKKLMLNWQIRDNWELLHWVN